MAHGARTHAKYSASNAHRVLRCPGQVALSATVPPRPDSEFTIEGEKAHELLERSLTGDVNWRRGADPEMIDAVGVVHDWLERLIIKHGNHLVIQIEQPFHFPQSVVPPDDAAGIADMMVVDYEAREAWSVDFKYGSGVAVEPEHNAQLLFNACGRLWRQPINKVHCVVIQPRIPHHRRGVVREWTCDAVALVEFQAEMENAILTAELAHLDMDRGYTPVLDPGPWCRWCPAETVCHARESKALALAYGDMPPAPHELDIYTPPNPASLGLDRVAHILHHKDMLTSWLKAIEDYARQQAMSGIPVPDHKLVEAQARRQWLGDHDMIAARLIDLSARNLTWDDVMPRSLLDITKAEALLVEVAKRAAPKGGKQMAAKDMREQMAFLTLKQSSGNLVLVPATDARPAADRASVAFQGVNIPVVE